MLGYLALIIGLISTIICVAIATSPSVLNVTALSTVISLPVAAAVGTSWIAGAACLLAYRQLTLPKGQSEVLKTWDKQDAKLAVEIQNDKVLQLEAKIQTLETALQSAIKKKKA